MKLAPPLWLALALVCISATFLVPDFLWWPVWIAGFFCAFMIVLSAHRTARPPRLRGFYAQPGRTPTTPAPAATSPQGRYCAGEIGIHTLDLLVGAQLGIKDDKNDAMHDPELRTLLGWTNTPGTVRQCAVCAGTFTPGTFTPRPDYLVTCPRCLDDRFCRGRSPSSQGSVAKECVDCHATFWPHPEEFRTRCWNCLDRRRVLATFVAERRLGDLQIGEAAYTQPWAGNHPDWRDYPACRSPRGTANALVVREPDRVWLKPGRRYRSHPNP
jgi:hypothetical protein